MANKLSQKWQQNFQERLQTKNFCLGDLEIIDSPTMFRQWMRCPTVLKSFLNCSPGEDYSFQAGRYLLKEHSSFQDAVSELRKGPIPEEVIRVTVPEGLTLEGLTL